MEECSSTRHPFYEATESQMLNQQCPNELTLPQYAGTGTYLVPFWSAAKIAGRAECRLEETHRSESRLAGLTVKT